MRVFAMGQTLQIDRDGFLAKIAWLAKQPDSFDIRQGGL